VSAEGVLERVQAIVARIAGPHRQPPGAGPDTPLGDEGYWLDSVDLLEVILACEETFGIVLQQPDDPVSEALRTPATLAAAVARRLAG
jgi:acyl carrier protein